MQETRERRDPRFPDQELVLGLEAGDRRRAYSLAFLRQQGAVFQDTFADRPIVVFTRPTGWISAAFERTLDGRVLEFVAAPAAEGLRETATGSLFDLTGSCVQGALAGGKLRRVPSSVEKWCAWSEAHPGAEIRA